MPQLTLDSIYGACPANIALGLPDQSDLARIPVVSSPYPKWFFHVCVVVDDHLWGGNLPTVEELTLIRRFLDYKLDWYSESYRRQMLARPFDIDGGTNTVSLLKRSPDDWCYRMESWTRGPSLVPTYDDPAKLTLVKVLDRASFADSWQHWQNAHPIPTA